MGEYIFARKSWSLVLRNYDEYRLNYRQNQELRNTCIMQKFGQLLIRCRNDRYREQSRKSEIFFLQ